MEFTGIGIVPYEPPAEELRPFMRRKLLTWLRSWEAYKDGILYREKLVEEAKLLANDYPEEEREAVAARRMKAWDNIMLCDTVFEPTTYCIRNRDPNTAPQRYRDEIGEEEFLKIWLGRVYAPPEQRKKLFENEIEGATTFFVQMDLNHDGVLQFDEFKVGFILFSEMKMKVFFDAIDINKDGVIQLEEFVYGILMHHFCSRPDDQFSLWFGDIIPEELC